MEFMKLLKSLMRRRGGDAYSSEPHPFALPTERDQQRVKTSGATFKLELIRAEAVEGGLSGCTSIAKDIIRKKKQQELGIPVLLTVAPTRIHIVRRKPWALLHDHLMDDIGVCFACRQDPRLVLVTARDEHTGTQMCYALRTPSKRDRGEASRICRVLKFASTYWQEIREPEHPRVVELRQKHCQWKSGNTVEDNCNKDGIHVEVVYSCRTI